ncbi:hypothetical protein Pmani_000520 [Petrolisthes manimaculis]|uniref:Uncharacterized protein n=1 Tax=Petrolisthes manimaculis TaxID=1843537 RepID=A0AAE1QLI0_9EUCA|nr:hypothetical protein Pmani_000520 [Petrolisthes manimaculis]
MWNFLPSIITFILTVCAPVTTAFVTYTFVSLPDNSIALDQNGSLAVLLVLLKIFVLGVLGQLPLNLNELLKKGRKRRDNNHHGPMLNKDMEEEMPCTVRILCELETAARTSSEDQFTFPQHQHYGEVDDRGQTLDDGDRVAGTLLDVDPLSDFHEEGVTQLFCPVRNDAIQHTPCQMDQGNMRTRKRIQHKDGPTAFLKDGRSKKDGPIRRQAKVEGVMPTTATRDQGNGTNLEVANIEAANIETANIQAANNRRQVKVEGETRNDIEDNNSNTVLDDKAQRYTPEQHVPINDNNYQTNSMERHALSLLTGLTAGGACERAYHLCPGRLTPLMAFGKLFRELQIESEVSGGDGDERGIEDGLVMES